jgi:8-oxo-dGTP diphosphatase
MSTEPIVRVGVATLVWRNGKFVVGKRLGSHGDGTWSIPGGHLEFGETWQQCAAREVLEETGMHIKNIRFLAITDDMFPANGKHYVTIWAEADWDSMEPTIMEPDKLVELDWATFATLPDPLFEPCWGNLRAIMPELFEQKG